MLDLEILMQEYTFIECLPTPAQYNALRATTGWRAYPEAVVAEALPNSLYGVCAYEGETLVGMARVIGDGGLAYYIQDVVVRPEYQGQGIGAQLMERVMAYIQAHAGDNAVIGLMAAAGKEAFYEKYGFTRRPTEKLGAGMTIFFQRI